MKNKKQEVKEVKPVEKKKTVNSSMPMHKGWGIAMLFVCVSIGYANYVVFFGTTGLIPKIMLIPSTVFVAVFLVIKSAK